MKKAVHNKTGNVYNILYEDVIECTNGREDIKYVVYSNAKGMIFCREASQFWEKFTLIEDLQ